jgi:16S rRNA (uracil1498-N3)-methyltransferase
MKKDKMARLFLNMPLIKGDKIRLTEDDTHYLANVIRKRIGSKLAVFNGIDGEWLAEILDFNKQTATLYVIEQFKIQEKDKVNLTLIFAIVKPQPMRFIIEKATELGVTRFIPLITDYTNFQQINYKKFETWIKEATEQSERITIPKIDAIVTLDKLLHHWPNENIIFLCNENEKSVRLVDVVEKNLQQNSYAFMVGPEGGFSDRELEFMSMFNNIKSVQIGPRILRADTAALAIISSFQSTFGDWVKGPR